MTCLTLHRVSNLFGCIRGYIGWRPTRWRKKTSNLHTGKCILCYCRCFIEMCALITAGNRHKQNSRFCKEIREDNFRFWWRRVPEDASQCMYISTIEICFLLLEYCKIRECYAVANAFTIRNMYSLLLYMKCNSRKINRPTKNMTKIVTLLHF
jgi:hypothetical protein